MRALSALLLVCLLASACSASQAGEAEVCLPDAPTFAMAGEQERLDNLDSVVIADPSFVAVGLCLLPDPIEAAVLTDTADGTRFASFGGTIRFGEASVDQLLYFAAVRPGTYELTGAAGYRRTVEVPIARRGCDLLVGADEVRPVACGGLSVVDVVVDEQVPPAVAEGIVYADARRDDGTSIDLWIMGVHVSQAEGLIIRVALDVARPTDIVVQLGDAVAPGGVRHALDRDVRISLGES